MEPLSGFQPAKAMVILVYSCFPDPRITLFKVFAGIFPIESNDFPKLEESINRVSLFS